MGARAQFKSTAGTGAGAGEGGRVWEGRVEWRRVE